MSPLEGLEKTKFLRRVELFTIRNAGWFFLIHLWLTVLVLNGPYPFLGPVFFWSILPVNLGGLAAKKWFASRYQLGNWTEKARLFGHGVAVAISCTIAGVALYFWEPLRDVGGILKGIREGLARMAGYKGELHLEVLLLALITLCMYLHRLRNGNHRRDED